MPLELPKNSRRAGVEDSRGYPAFSSLMPKPRPTVGLILADLAPRLRSRGPLWPKTRWQASADRNHHQASWRSSSLSPCIYFCSLAKPHKMAAKEVEKSINPQDKETEEQMMADRR